MHTNNRRDTLVDVPMLPPCEWDERDITPQDLMCDSIIPGGFPVRACGRKEESNLQANPGSDTVCEDTLVSPKGRGTVVMSPSELRHRAMERMYANLRKQLQEANVRKVRAQVSGDRDTYLAQRALAADLRARLTRREGRADRVSRGASTAILPRVAMAARTVSRLARLGIVLGAGLVLVSGIIAGCLAR